MRTTSEEYSDEMQEVMHRLNDDADQNRLKSEVRDAETQRRNRLVRTGNLVTYLGTPSSTWFKTDQPTIDQHRNWIAAIADYKAA